MPMVEYKYIVRASAYVHHLYSLILADENKVFTTENKQWLQLKNTVKETLIKNISLVYIEDYLPDSITFS